MTGSGHSSVHHNHPPNMATHLCPACLASPRTFHWYSLDNEFALVCARSLRRMLTEGYSHPSWCTPDEWALLLVEMAEGFEEYADEDRDEGEKWQRAMDLFHAHYRDLWD